MIFSLWRYQFHKNRYDYVFAKHIKQYGEKNNYHISKSQIPRLT